MLPLLLALLVASSALADQQVSPSSPPLQLAPQYGPPVAYSSVPTIPGNQYVTTYPASVPAGPGRDVGAPHAEIPSHGWTHLGDADNTFIAETGVESYLQPEAAEIPGLQGFLRLLPIAKAIALGSKLLGPIGFIASGFLLLLLLGGALTTAVCTFTPLCTISFLSLARSTVRSYAKPDKLTQATAFVLDAVDKYRDLSKKLSKEERAAREKKWH